MDLSSLLDPTLSEKDVQTRAAALASLLRQRENSGAIFQAGGPVLAPIGKQDYASAQQDLGRIGQELEKRPAMALEQARVQQMKRQADLASNPDYATAQLQVARNAGLSLSPEAAARIGATGVATLAEEARKNAMVPKFGIVPAGSAGVFNVRSGEVKTGGGINNDVKVVADAIQSGEQPPDFKGMFRNSFPVRAELGRRGFNVTKAQQDWTAVQKNISTLNNAQNSSMRQAYSKAESMINELGNQYAQWQATAPTSDFKAFNGVALAAAKQLPGKAGQLAHMMEAMRNDLVSDMAQIYMRGGVPTDHAMALADKNLSLDWNKTTFTAGLEQLNRAIGWGKKALAEVTPLTPGGAPNQYVPQAPPLGQPPVIKAHPADNEAVQWAKANPTDPRAAAILKANGAQ